jgi:hypothetical protein
MNKYLVYNLDYNKMKGAYASTCVSVCECVMRMYVTLNLSMCDMCITRCKQWVFIPHFEKGNGVLVCFVLIKGVSLLEKLSIALDQPPQLRCTWPQQV